MNHAVTGGIHYIVNTGEKLINETFGPEDISRRRTGTQVQTRSHVQVVPAPLPPLGVEDGISSDGPSWA